MKKIVAIVFACLASASSEAGVLPAEQNQQVQSRAPDAKPHRPREQMAQNSGVLDAIDRQRAQLTIYGNPIAYDAQQIKVFKGRQRASVSQLVPGTRIRYQFDSAGPERKIVRIWIGE